MRVILKIFILSFVCQISFGQACGFYRINYVGEIHCSSFKVAKVKLPTTIYLHKLEEEKTQINFVEVNLNESEINLELYSHQTIIFNKAEHLKKFYERTRDNFPIIILAEYNGIKKELVIELNWEDISITKIKDNKFGYLFQIDLNKVEIEIE